MVRLSPAQYPAAHALYLDHGAYFPLIAAVLCGAQDGVIYADREEEPNQVYVEHAFGFAQIFGKPLPAFERALQRYLLVDRAFTCAKVRLYTPHYPGFLQVSENDVLRSLRQHFRLGTARAGTDDHAPEEPEKGLTLVRADASHVNLIDDAFGVVGRFWRTPDDFAHHSNAVVAMVEGQAAALCYAAAVADGRAEIDVLTLPAYRHLGLAKAVVRLFNQRCLELNVLPQWDCFTNNTASMALCRSAGFVPLDEPYPFFTINR
jgi:GNAT superfamily N-acetyltransferase